MTTVGELIKELQQFDPDMEVDIPVAFNKHFKEIDFTTEFNVDQTCCYDPSLKDGELWVIQICPDRTEIFGDEE